MAFCPCLYTLLPAPLKSILGPFPPVWWCAGPCAVSGLVLLAGWLDIMCVISNGTGRDGQGIGLYFFDFSGEGGGAARAPKEPSQKFL